MAETEQSNVAPASGRGRSGLVAAVVVLSLLLLVAVGFIGWQRFRPGQGSGAHSLAGTLTVRGGMEGCVKNVGGTDATVYDRLTKEMDAMTKGTSPPPPLPCPLGPGGGYSDIRDGATVLVLDQAGTTIAKGSLTDGQATGLAATWNIAVPALPAADFYQVTIGSRGGQTYSATDLAAANWTVSLSLGD